MTSRKRDTKIMPKKKSGNTNKVLTARGGDLLTYPERGGVDCPDTHPFAPESTNSMIN